MINKIYQTFKTIKNIHIFILEYFGFIRSGDLLYKTYNNTKMWVRAGTTDISEVIVVNSDHEYPQKYFPKSRHPVILDVGAGIGEFSVYISKLLNGRGDIYAIEPSIGNYKYLLKNIRLNNINNIVPCKFALSSKTGSGYLNISQSNDSHTLIKSYSKNIKTEEVNLYTLEAFCYKYHLSKIDLLKIDIEGGEYDLFNKSIKFITENVKLIIIECHDVGVNMNFIFMSTLMKKNNFKILEVINSRSLVLQNVNSKLKSN